MVRRGVKWVIGTIVGVVVVLLIVGGVVLWIVAGGGGSVVEQWVGGQVVGVANGYLNPHLAFKNLDYQYPRTLVLTNVTLTAPAPGSSSAGSSAAGSSSPGSSAPGGSASASPAPQNSASGSSAPGGSTPGESASTGPSASAQVLASTPATGKGGESPHQEEPSGPEGAPGGLADTPADGAGTGGGSKGGSGGGAVDLSKPVQILTIKKLTIELAAIPRPGQPIRIRELDIEGPTVKLIAPDPAHPGRLLGYARLFKSKKKRTKKFKLSDMFRIRHIKLKDGKIFYDVPSTGTPPMRLRGLATSMNIEPKADAKGNIWHSIHASLTRAPVFQLGIDGQVNLDARAAKLQALTLTTRLGRKYDHALPPQLASMLAKHDVTGRLNLDVSGRLDGKNPMASELQTKLQLHDVNAAEGDYKLPVSLAKLVVRARRGKAEIQGFEVDTLGGRITARGRVRYDRLDFPANLSVRVKGLKLEDALRGGNANPDTPPKMAGDVNAKVNFKAPLIDAMTRASGQGRVTLRHGELAHIPVISDLQHAIARVASTLGTKRLGDRRDTADLAFDLRGDKAAFTRIDVTSSFFGAKGEGNVYFNQNLDLTLQAGPLERIQNKLGPLGSIVGSIAGMVSKYRVTGTLEKPHIGVQVAGGVFHKIPLIGGSAASPGDNGNAPPAEQAPPTKTTPPAHHVPPPNPGMGNAPAH